MSHVMRRILVVAIVLASVAAGRRMEAQTGYKFVPIVPCRVVDTRTSTVPNFPNPNGPPQVTGAGRTFQIRGRCGVPTAAQAVTVTVTVVTPAGMGFISLFPGGTSYPGISNVNFSGGEAAVANGAVVMLGPNTAPDLSAVSGVTNTDVLIDVLGYYQ